MRGFIRAIAKHPALYTISAYLIEIIFFVRFGASHGRFTNQGAFAGFMFLVMVLLCLPLLIIFTPSIVRNWDAEEEAARKREEERRKSKEQIRYRESVKQANDDDAVKFYRDCAAERILDMEKESDQERLMLYAKRNHIEGTKDELVASFQKGKEIATGVDREEKIKKLREEEKALEKENRAYLGYSGRDKLIQICKDEIQNNESLISECRGIIEQIQSGGSTLYQKEHSWATAGGIASGIGGPVVGLAAAIDTQQKNASIRASNETLINVISNSVDPYYKKIVDAKEKIGKWQTILDKAEKCLVETNSSKNYLQYLDIEVREKKLSETGAGRIKLNIRQKNAFNIFGDANAVVDGSIKVLLKKNGETVGEGMYVFPYCGSGRKYGEFPEVVCYGSRIPSAFDVEFVANNLWGLEKLE